MSDELRKLAEDVPNAKKWYQASVLWDYLTHNGEDDPEPDAAFIHAASPDVVLGLLDEITRARRAFMAVMKDLDNETEIQPSTLDLIRDFLLPTCG